MWFCISKCQELPLFVEEGKQPVFPQNTLKMLFIYWCSHFFLVRIVLLQKRHERHSTTRSNILSCPGLVSSIMHNHSHMHIQHEKSCDYKRLRFNLTLASRILGYHGFTHNQSMVRHADLYGQTFVMTLTSTLCRFQYSKPVMTAEISTRPYFFNICMHFSVICLRNERANTEYRQGRRQASRHAGRHRHNLSTTQVNRGTNFFLASSN